MNKNTFKAVKLTKGEVNVYDFGTVKLHAYKTNDFINNEVFIVEKNGNAVIIESPCFFDNIKELTEYLNNISVAGMLVSYHGAGATFLPVVPKYATQNAVDYSENGGGKNGKVEGYQVGGKTATSETLPRGTGRYISSFLGFAPADDPKVLALCIIRNPQGVYYGGLVAAPVVRELFENILPYLDEIGYYEKNETINRN